MHTEKGNFNSKQSFTIIVIVFLIDFYLGAIELCHATMAKSDRQNVSEVYPLFFIPCYLLPNETPSCLDPFLKIIIDELEELFINGRFRAFCKNKFFCKSKSKSMICFYRKLYSYNKTLILFQSLNLIIFVLLDTTCFITLNNCKDFFSLNSKSYCFKMQIIFKVECCFSRCWC